VETSTQTETYREGRKWTREVDKLLSDVRENVGTPTSQRRQRKLPDQYTRYMTLMSEMVETKPSSFKVDIEQPIWIDSMVEEYDSIVRNNVWEVVPRPKNKSMIGSR